mmetsp:Transcript_3501/g.8271  ORF Transcript_3501/g.8271 Transcript_3501/m.8271 type:complete len:232 (-) Transcript_3501:194-889(-)
MLRLLLPSPLYCTGNTSQDTESVSSEDFVLVNLQREISGDTCSSKNTDKSWVKVQDKKNRPDNSPITKGFISDVSGPERLLDAAVSNETNIQRVRVISTPGNRLTKGIDTPDLSGKVCTHSRVKLEQDYVVEEDASTEDLCYWDWRATKMVGDQRYAKKLKYRRGKTYKKSLQEWTPYRGNSRGKMKGRVSSSTGWDDTHPALFIRRSRKVIAKVHARDALKTFRLLGSFD